MEITRKNKGDYLGYVDGETGIFINEDNYEQKFEKFLSDPENPKWEKIANAGRNYALKNFNNDKAANSLVDLMESML
jgi:glycosyltransferase involved in cell wall biosynthesis